MVDFNKKGTKSSVDTAIIAVPQQSKDIEVKGPETTGLVLSAADFMRSIRESGDDFETDITLKLDEQSGIEGMYLGPAQPILLTGKDDVDEFGQPAQIQTWYVRLYAAGGVKIRARLLGDYYINSFFGPMEEGRAFKLFKEGEVDTRKGRRVHTYLSAVGPKPIVERGVLEVTSAPARPKS